MIFDEIDNWEKYFGHLERFHEIFEELNSVTPEKANGIYRINSSCYYKIMSYKTKIFPSIIESHKKEVDVQISLKGKEHIKIYSADNVETLEEYDSKTDCEFYKDNKGSDLELNLIPGKMAVFFPQDIHGCQYAFNNQASEIKKVVIKIDEKFFTHH